MATEAEVLQAVIEPMTALYGRPYGCRTDAEAERAQAEYIKTLRGLPIDALREGWADIRRDRTKQTWPSPGELYQATKPYLLKRVRDEDKPKISPQQARVLLNTTREGAMAFRLQIPASFIAFSVREGRIPTEREIRDIGAERLTAENVPEICAKIQDGATRARFERLGMAIVQRNAKLMAEAE